MGSASPQDRLQERQDRLRRLIEPVVAAAGYDLEDLTVANRGHRSSITVVIDSDHGVDLDQVAGVSRAVAASIEADDATLGPRPYVLEVTSPGIDRPLVQPRHWRRSVGRRVRVRAGSDEQVEIEGRVIAADDVGVRLDVDGEERELAYTNLGRGRVQVEFNRPQGGRR